MPQARHPAQHRSGLPGHDEPHEQGVLDEHRRRHQDVEQRPFNGPAAGPVVIRATGTNVDLLPARRPGVVPGRRFVPARPPNLTDDRGLFERTGNLWRAQGRRARLEFKHFRRRAMINVLLRQEDVEGWRGEIRDSEVVKIHEEALEEEQRAQEEQSAPDETTPDETAEDELPEDAEDATAEDEGEGEGEGELHDEEPETEADYAEEAPAPGHLPGARYGRCVSHGWTTIDRCDRDGGREEHPRATERPRVCRDRCGSPAHRRSRSVGDRRTGPTARAMVRAAGR